MQSYTPVADPASAVLLTDYEMPVEKVALSVKTKVFHDLVEALSNASSLYVIGNGGLHYVASHMVTDITRLVPHISGYSFDSTGFITSNANDHGYENLFRRWLEVSVPSTTVDNPDSCVVIGLSCSGTSKNIIHGLNYSSQLGFSTFLVSGVKNLNYLEPQLSFDCKYFHSVECICLMLFYEIIHRLGESCPTIAK